MNCPTCHKPLTAESLHGQIVDRCGACNGLWIDHGELAPLVRHTQPRAVAVKPVAGSGDIDCPKCAKSLAPFNYAHDSGVLIQRCALCDGFWIESGQLELLAKYRSGSPAIQRLSDALADEIRASNRLQFARRLLRSRLLSGMVASFYLLFVVLATGSLEAVVRLILFLVLPIVCIWFPDKIGNLKGISLGLARPMITHETPGDFVAIGGWLLLLCPAVALIVGV
jgi:Zn-finger nucleic acid-binding protein